jgi:hypothetical protein
MKVKLAIHGQQMVNDRQGFSGRTRRTRILIDLFQRQTLMTACARTGAQL